MSNRFLSSLAAGASALALTFTSLSHAGVANDPNHALTASAMISGALIKESGLSNNRSEQFMPPRELADKLMKEVVAALNAPKDKNIFIAYGSPNPAGGTFGVAAVVPAKGLPANTPIPVCLNKNNSPTSAWMIIPETGKLEPAKVLPNTPEQASRHPCFATLQAEKKELDRKLAQLQQTAPAADTVATLGPARSVAQAPTSP